MGKFIIFMWLCSVTTTIDCRQIKVDRVKFSDQYDCVVYGYTHSTKLLREFGREEVNEYKAFIRFACIEKPKIDI